MYMLGDRISYEVVVGGQPKKHIIQVNTPNYNYMIIARNYMIQDKWDMIILLQCILQIAMYCSEKTTVCVFQLLLIQFSMLLAFCQMMFVK